MEQQAAPVYLLIGTPTYRHFQVLQSFPHFPKVISVYAGMTSFFCHISVPISHCVTLL